MRRNPQNIRIKAGLPKRKDNPAKLAPSAKVCWESEDYEYAVTPAKNLFEPPYDDNNNKILVPKKGQSAVCTVRRDAPDACRTYYDITMVRRRPHAAGEVGSSGNPPEIWIES